MIDPDPTIQTLPPEDTPSVPPTTILVKLPTAQDDEARAREAVTDERTHARIGILFVHGMGDQQRGSSLQRFGDPIVQWLRRWQSYDFDRQLMTISEQAPASIESGIEPTEESVSTIPTSSPLGYTVIKGQGADPASFEPPNSELTLLRASRKPGQPTSASWIMTEAWWADAFFPPKFSDVAKWGLGVGPRFVVRHFELPTSGLPRLPQAIQVRDRPDLRPAFRAGDHAVADTGGDSVRPELRQRVDPQADRIVRRPDGSDRIAAYLGCDLDSGKQRDHVAEGNQGDAIR